MIFVCFSKKIPLYFIMGTFTRSLSRIEQFTDQKRSNKNAPTFLFYKGSPLHRVFYDDLGGGKRIRLWTMNDFFFSCYRSLIFLR
jgi:hypothetical protein